MKIFITILLFLFGSKLSGQETYKIGKTEYYYNKTYHTTGKPMVKRSSVNKRIFLKSLGLKKIPKGYEIDHIIPLSEGGSDAPSNMQLLTIEQHNIKTAKERAKNSNSTYSEYNGYYSNSTYNNDSYEYVNDKKIYTGKRGGRYYINRNGKKSYIKSKQKSSSRYKYNSGSSNSSSICGARTKSGSFCKRKVKGGGRCYLHK